MCRPPWSPTHLPDFLVLAMLQNPRNHDICKNWFMAVTINILIYHGKPKIHSMLSLCDPENGLHYRLGCQYGAKFTRQNELWMGWKAKSIFDLSDIFFIVYVLAWNVAQVWASNKIFGWQPARQSPFKEK